MKSFFSITVRKLQFLLGALIVASVGIYFAQSYYEQRAEKGRSALFKVQKLFEEEAKTLTEAEKGDGVIPEVETRFSKTIAGYRALIDDASLDSMIRFEAAIGLAKLLTEGEVWEKALVEYQKAKTVAPSNDFHQSVANYLMGVAHENLKQHSDATRVLADALGRNFEGLKAEILLALVRNHVAMNEKEKAKLYLEKLNLEFAGSKAAQDAQDWIQ